ncbi:MULTISPECIES: M48 family metalloprotease [Sphingobium]|uniref:M48 family metalloprotease n=1 Tax=Sphingobium TaxID=165695 RepID=UPI0015EC7574|nr:MULTISPECIES: M48 family metalloprotease [Sphingobium]MCW2361742.1 putative Zn-dependent protease [Sphingobium sp. B10D3B]MCW2401579.1 putative Zn-dependent protease [Sphingobium sp. B10D7B]MCW2408559.1 putative Zn-dependent protease [Sphingobium xanthum]
MGRKYLMLWLSGALVAGCATTQSSEAQQGGIRTATSMSQSERQQGAKAHPELLAEFGGVYNGPQATYVTSVGKRIAVQSSLSNQQNDFTISLLNSSVNNAFAIPGGYVYVTRQLLALMNDEAELAGVLGHEVGHVAAQHGQRRQSAATRNSILGVLGQVLVGAVAGDSGLGQLLQRGIGTGTQLLTLKFSRSQEYEADDLGIRYLASAGYDPKALSSMLASLAAQNTLDGQVRGQGTAVPEWASTHPDPASRVRRALTNAQATRSTNTLRNRDVFLNQLGGMIYGDDPKDGIVQGNQFLHPVMKLKFTAPQGFSIQNGASAVAVVGQSGQAQFSMAQFNGNLDGYVQSVFNQLAGQGQAPDIRVQRTTINGLPVASGSASMANSQGTRLDVTVVAYQFGPSTAYHFITVTPAGRGLGSLSTLINSVTRMTDKEAAAIKPRRLQLVKVRQGDTVQTLASLMAFDDYKVERFLVLNGLSSNTALAAGSRVKIVTY